MTSVNDIKKKLKGYRYGDQTARDAHALTENFKGLKVRDLKPFVHSNGSKENCTSLNGTIPVKIRGTTYNIPITLWLRPNHPYTGPLVYVSPTGDMGIQQSPFVDASGMVYLPYISEWKQGSSDLTTLVQVMCATFADHCPVYSKKAAPQRPQPPHQGGWAQPHRPVQPPTTYSTPNTFPAPRYPAQTPYPPGQPQYQQPRPNPYQAMPTPYVPGGGGYQPQRPPTTGAQPPYPQQAQGQYGGMYAHQSPQQSLQGHPQPVSQPPIHSPPATSIQSNFVSAVPAGHAALSAEDERKQMEEHERIKRSSLETAVEDKIRRQVKQVLDAAQVEMDTMMATQEKLKKGSQEINQMLDEMENKKREVDQSIDLLRTKKTELVSLLDYLRAQPEKINVDESIAATNPLYNQILRLYAEENAIDDTIYYLGEALRKGVIDLDAFLKHVRELSRQQFIARATIMKARTTAGLSQHGVPA